MHVHASFSETRCGFVLCVFALFIHVHNVPEVIVLLTPKCAVLWSEMKPSEVSDYITINKPL